MILNPLWLRLRELDQINSFLEVYGFDQSDSVLRAETFGTFQEALQFIRRYFLKEGNVEGLALSVPASLCGVTNIEDLLRAATWAGRKCTYEECLWAQVILKVMHTILHIDKDLRYNYISQIQQQIFDRFYKYLSRDEGGGLYLKNQSDQGSVLLVDFETKSQKERDSVIIKLLHKEENIIEELFDRIGVRFITNNRLDCLRVIKFLHQHNVIIVHNIKPSRSRNSLIDLQSFKKHHHSVLMMALRNNISEERFQQALNRKVKDVIDDNYANVHSSRYYRSIQFTSYHLIKYRNPFADEFIGLRNQAKSIYEEKGDSDPLAKRVVNMDYSLVSRDIRFFYPFEIQIVDKETRKNNDEGKASHREYKKNQLKSAMKRLFKPLIEHKGLHRED